MPTKKTVKKTVARPRVAKTPDIGQKIAKAFISGRVSRDGGFTMATLREKRERIRADFIDVSRKMLALNMGNNWKAELTSKAETELERTKKLPKVLKVECVGSVVKVYTDTLFCYHSQLDKYFEVGKMRIEIDFNFDYDEFDDHESDIKWFNLTRRVSGIDSRMQAPHVYSDGVPCLGGFSEIIPPLIAEFELSALVMVAIQFVETINPGDYPYEEEINWPRRER